MTYVLDDAPVQKQASFASSLKRNRLRELMESPDTPATILAIICFDHFGTDWLEFEPDTLRMELRDEIAAEPPQVNFDKIWAIAVILTTNMFYESLETFIPICNALSDHEASFTHFDPADAEELSWGVTEAKLIDPPEEETEVEFSEDIKLYTGERLRSEGFIRTPEVLRWATFKDGNEGEARVDRFQDDPIFFNALWDREQKEIDAVNAYVQARLNRVMTILKDLPLISGSTTKLFKS